MQGRPFHKKENVHFTFIVSSSENENKQDLQFVPLSSFAIEFLAKIKHKRHLILKGLQNKDVS